MNGQIDFVECSETAAVLIGENLFRVDLYLKSMALRDGVVVDGNLLLQQFGIGEVFATAFSDRPFRSVGRKFRIEEMGNGVSWTHSDFEELGMYETVELAKLAIEKLHRIHSSEWPHLGSHKNWNSHPSDE